MQRLKVLKIKCMILLTQQRRITNLATTTILNTKLNDAKNKIHNITYLDTTAALIAAENKFIIY